MPVPTDRRSIASPKRAPLSEANQATGDTWIATTEGHRSKQLNELSCRSELRVAPTHRIFAGLTDQPCVRPRHNEAARKGRPPDPGLPIKRLCLSEVDRRRGSEFELVICCSFAETAKLCLSAQSVSLKRPP